MSKERELLEAMRASLHAVPTPTPAPGDAAASPATAIDVGRGLEIVGDIFTSLASDPVFYIKVAGVLVLTVMIIMISIELIAGGG